VLATTREPLGAQGEITWRIPPLGLPPEEERDAEQILRYDAARLFVERASAADSGFRLEAGTASIVCRICRRLDGLPLALELAAARVRTLSPERLADGLDDRFRLLTGGSRTGMARQRTLLASVEWSHDLLDEPERILLRRLGVFAASFTIEAAEAVAADDALDRFAVFDLLSHLVDKSLVQRSGDRYHMLETLRHFALERAADAEELAELRNRHLAWFERRARAWKLDRELARHPVLDEVALESPNLLAALEWSLDPSREMATSLLVALVPHFRRRNAYQDLRTVYRQVLGQLQEGSQAWLEALAPMASDLYFAAEVGWMPAAERSLVELGDAVSPTVRGLVSHALAIGRAFHGLPDGLRALEQAAEVGRAATNALLEGTALLALSSTLATIGERTRLHALLPWLDRHVPADAQMRFLLDHAYACVAAYDADFTTARERVASYLDGACPVPIATQAGLTGLWTSDPVLVRKAIDVAEQSFSIGAFATSMRWLHALAPLLGGDLEAAEQHLDDPAPWLMPTASTRIFLMRAEIALARDDAPRATMLTSSTRVSGARPSTTSRRLRPCYGPRACDGKVRSTRRNRQPTARSSSRPRTSCRSSWSTLSRRWRFSPPRRGTSRAQRACSEPRRGFARAPATPGGIPTGGRRSTISASTSIDHTSRKAKAFLWRMRWSSRAEVAASGAGPTSDGIA
jgi:predicted ATPase